MRLIYNSDAQRLQKNFDDKTPVTVSELFRTERTASLPIELFLVDDDGGYETPSSSDYEVIIGRQGQAITTGKLTLTFTGTTEEIDLSKPKLATRIEAALNAVSAVDSAGGVDVIELSPRAFQITFRSNGSRAAMSAAVAQSMQPASALISEVTAGTVSSREVQLLTLEEASLAEVSTSGWSTNSNPTLTITTLVEGTANTREVVQLSVTGDPASGSFFVVSNSEPISTEATAAQVKSILNAALSNDIGSVKKTGERIWQITYKTNGDKTALSAGTHNLVKRPSVNATLSLNTTALAYAANSDGSDLSVGFTLRKGTEILLSEPIDLHEPFAKTLGSSASLSNAVTLTPFLELAGGTMSGAIAMGSQKITGLADGVASSDAATKGQIDALIDGSPDNLNTLNELAAALNDDQNFSTTVTNNIATKLPKDGSAAMTGALQITTGSAASPSLSFSSDTDTGIFHGTDAISFSINGSRKAYVSTSGLWSDANVYHSSTGSFRGYGYDAVISTNSGYGIVFKPNDSIFGKFTSAGNLGIGSDFSADKTLVVRAANAEIAIDDIDTTDTPRLRFRESGSTSASIRTDASNLIFDTGLNEAARFDSSGHFLIGDDKKIKLGADGDLEIYNAANDNSVIKKTTSGGLFLLNDSTTYIQGTFGEDIARFIKDGANQFYYDGSLKLSTSSTGATVSGSLLIDSTYPRIFLTDSNNNSDFSIINNDGSFSIYDDTNSANRLQILADGKVGIGGAPVVELDLQGDMMVTNTAPRFILKESGSAKDICFKVQTDGRLSVFDDNQVNEMITVKQDGNVGIGGLPIAQTYIESDNNSFAATGTPSNYHLVLRNPQNDLNEGVGIGFTSSTGTDSIGAAIAFERTGNQAQGDLVFSAKSSTSAGASLDELIRLDGSTGNVGIGGVTSPQANLHIFKTEGGVGAKHATIRLGGYTTTGAEISAYRFDGNSNNQGLIFSSHDETDGIVERMRIASDGNITQNYINYTDASNYEALKFSAESDHIKINTESVGSFSSETRDLRFNINGTEKGRVSSAGVWTMNNFYISGTGSLRNYGNNLKFTTGGGDYDIEFNPNDTTQMILKSDTGRLGVNNTNPQKTIDVTGDIRASTNLFASNNIYAAFKFVFGSSTSEGEYIERHGGSDLAFYGNGGHRFTVKGSGDCKIEDAGKGLILNSPDGTAYKITVANDGTVTSTAV